MVGANERLDTLQAAVLRVKLRHLERWNALRRTHASTYAELLQGSGAVVPETRAAVEHVWHLYVIRVSERDELRAALGERGIQTGMHYPLPLHLQPATASLGYRSGDFPITEAWAERLLSLPMFPELEAEELERVAGAVRELVQAPAGAPSGA